MRFERPIKGTFVAGLAAFTLSACGADKIEPIRVPNRTINQGFGYDSQGDYGRIFRLNNKEVQLLKCGSINGDEAIKDIDPAGDGMSQVECSANIDSMPDASEDDVIAYQQLPVDHIKP